MQIAVNAIFLQNNPLEGYGHYAKEVVWRMARAHPEHRFILVFDRPWDPGFSMEPNMVPVLVGPAARHPLAYKYWYDIKAPLALRGFKPDVWFQPYGFCSLTTRIPQVLMVHDLAFKHYPQFLGAAQRWYYGHYTGAFLKKASRVITVSDYSRQDIQQHYAVAEQKITVIPGAARPGFQPLDWEAKLAVKSGYADGREYFLFVGSIHPRKNLMNLLRAYSLFKKWQHSNMKLLIAGRLAWQNEDLLEKLKTYKYREDVVMLGYLEEEQLYRVMGAAYALVYPSYWEGFGLPVVEAMQSGVPVITSNTSSLTELAADAALLASPDDPDAIAQQMLALYRTEAIRNQYIHKGLERSRAFDWNQTAEACWEQLLLAVNR
ncbi:MAG: glycosyltransferase family 4 protein [Chitinophagaceae bacterium]|nr:glycosyltransferase family 4 protein [Chitinophagaceae bacterium]